MQTQDTRINRQVKADEGKENLKIKRTINKQVRAYVKKIIKIMFHNCSKDSDSLSL